jgi:hypothetical protein
MRILAKNSITNKLSFPLIISRFNHTFFVVCMDDINTINFYKNITLFKHSSYINFIKWFRFSDAYVCFFDSYGFIDLLRIYLAHFLASPKDGINMILGFVFNGSFVNMFNTSLVENILSKSNYLLDLDNFFVQIIIVIVKMIEVFIFYSIDTFLLHIENFMFDF